MRLNKKKHKQIRPTQNTPRNLQQPGNREQLGTALDETTLTISHYSPASVESRFVEIGVVQLSQSMTIVTHTQTQRQTGRQITIYNGTLYAPR